MIVWLELGLKMFTSKTVKYYTLLVGFLSYLLFKSIYAFVFILMSMGVYSSALDEGSVLILVYSSTILVILGNVIVVSLVKEVKLALPLILFGLIIAFRVLNYNVNIELAKFMMGTDIDYKLVAYLHWHDAVAVLLFDVGFLASFLAGVLMVSKNSNKQLLDQEG